MQQTILALGALMIIMITAISHQRSAIMIQEMAYVRELENAALDVAKIRTESLLNQTTFDELWIGEAHLPNSTTLLTTTASFGPDPGDTAFDDIDDAHNFTERYTHSIGDDTYDFLINYAVAYVDSMGNATYDRTFAKQITANVASVDTIGVRVAKANYSKTTIISEDL